MDKKNKVWLSTKEAIQLFKKNKLSITARGLDYLRLHNIVIWKSEDDYHKLYNLISLKGYIKSRLHIPSELKYIKITDLAKELHVHKCRIYKRLKDYRTHTIKHLGITYVNKQEFLKKYKEEYNGNTDGRKKARN